MLMPETLCWLKGHPTGADWVQNLPRLLEDLRAEWSLDYVGAPYENANVSWVAPVRQRGRPVVLKIQWPHEECRYEADALAVWGGEGAVRLIAHDRDRHALLLEHCEPGTPLSEHKETDKLGVFIDLLPRLWKPTGAPFTPLSQEAQGWASRIVANWERAGRPCERSLVDAARDWLLSLLGSQGEEVLVHQDLHGENVLASSRDGWLAIDPKPLVGEREFALAPIIRSFELGHSPSHVFDRLDRLTSELALDRERSRGWAIGQTVAWSFDGAYASQHMETARWLVAGR